MDTKVTNHSSYVVPFNLLLRQIGLDLHLGDGDRIEMTREQFLSLIRRLLASVPVDEHWYTTTYKDIDEAIQAGLVSSAKDHFVSNGYFEGRLPAKVVV